MEFVIIGKGFIGSRLSDYLQSQNHIVHHISRVEVNYADEDILYQYLSNATNCDAVINTAGFTGKPNVDECEIRRPECFNLNVVMPRTLEMMCKLLDLNFIHISSGCVYDGYEKVFTEDDVPNFGIYDDRSSFYSKTKHAGELNLDDDFTNIVRIRMPIEGKVSSKNLLTKLLAYDNLINYRNSKTDVYTLCEYIETVADNFQAGIFNAVHSNALTTKEVVSIMKEYDIENEQWKFVPYEDLDIKCNRSNCILSNQKAKDAFEFDWGDEEYYIRQACEMIREELI